MRSVSTWTLDGLSSDDLIALDDVEVWRFVEAQHEIATTSLVDNWREQELLEDILEETKPPIPPEAKHLDFLRMTPFRYRAAKGATSNDRGSRFRASGASYGVFYGAFDPETAAYETAFYSALFFSESPNMVLPKNALSYTAFQSKISTRQVLDLTSHPELSKFASSWEAPDDYRDCQRLALEARDKGVEALVFKSVRDPNGRKNIAILTPEVFAASQPIQQQTWTILCNEHGLQIACDMPKKRLSVTFQDLEDMGDKRFTGISFSI